MYRSVDKSHGSMGSRVIILCSGDKSHLKRTRICDTIKGHAMKGDGVDSAQGSVGVTLPSLPERIFYRKGGSNMGKKVFLILLILLFFLSFSMSLAGTKEKKATIRFMAALYSEATTPFWEDMIEAFEAEYPNVEVELDVVHWDNVYQKTTTLISAGQEPDILNTDTILVQYAAEGLLEPLDPYMDAEFRDRFIPAMLKSGLYDGKIQSLPFLASVRALFYNKDVFEKHRVQPPRTAQELVEVGLEINDPPDFYAFGMPITNFGG
jgi:ABC-type glycerol-3-phosphate transport system substrate-binding protein